MFDNNVEIRCKNVYVYYVSFEANRIKNDLGMFNKSSKEIIVFINLSICNKIKKLESLLSLTRLSQEQ